MILVWPGNHIFQHFCPLGGVEVRTAPYYSIFGFASDPDAKRNAIKFQNTLFSFSFTWFLEAYGGGSPVYEFSYKET